MAWYRMLSAINRGFPLAVFWVYVAAFVLALSMVFLFPVGPLIMVLIGLLGLVLATLTASALGFVERLSARLILGRGACPRCGEGVASARDDALSWRCAACGAVFGPCGTEQRT